MKVQPNDIRYMIVVPKHTITKDGVVTAPHVYADDLPTYDSAEASRPMHYPSTVRGYVKATRSTKPSLPQAPQLLPQTPTQRRPQ